MADGGRARCAAGGRVSVSGVLAEMALERQAGDQRSVR
jgi:hypothetical protein